MPSMTGIVVLPHGRSNLGSYFVQKWPLPAQRASDHPRPCHPGPDADSTEKMPLTAITGPGTPCCRQQAATRGPPRGEQAARPAERAPSKAFCGNRPRKAKDLPRCKAKTKDSVG